MKKLFLSFLFLAAIIYSASGQTKSPINLEELDQYYSKMVADWDIPGATIGIVKDGELVFVGSYGVMEVGKSVKPDGNALYGIASISKAFTATLLAMLEQEGKIKWNDRVRDYLPYFEVYDPWVSNNVTIRDLLCHRVGVGTFSGDVMWYKSDFSAEDIVRRAKYLSQAFGFRAGYGYSNIMYIAAGEVIRAVTGKSWSQNVKERIFEPLGMNRSTTSPRHLKALGNHVTPHAREDDVNLPIGWEDWEEIGALGGIITSVNDIANWMILNLNKGIFGSDTLVSRSNINLMWTPHASFVVDHSNRNEFNQNFRSYGLGWGLGDIHGRLRVAHSGAIDGMITSLALVPDENLGVVVLTNGMRSPITAATNYALELFMGLTPRDWSAQLLERTKSREQADTRISDRKERRVLGTSPSLPLKEYAGTYKSDMHGNINVLLDAKNQLRLEFENSKYLSATLKHWHYDVWEIIWDNKHAWFSFGTVKFNLDNNLKIQGIDFDVPNDDIFFEEIKPVRVR